MNKKGQLTVFIILGVIVILLVGLLLYTTRQSETVSKEELDVQRAVEQLPSNVRVVRDHVQSCVQDTAERSVFYFGMVGAEITPDPWPGYYQYDTTFKVPYYYVKGKSYSPSLVEVQRILGEYLNQYIGKCFAFDQFSGMQIRAGKPKTTVEVDPVKVNYKSIIPVTVQLKDGSSLEIEPQYFAHSEVRMQEIVAVANEIVKREVQNDLLIHWDYMSDVVKTGLEVTAYPEKDETIVYKIVDPNAKLFRSEPFILHFANKVKTKEP